MRNVEVYNNIGSADDLKLERLEMDFNGTFIPRKTMRRISGVIRVNAEDWCIRTNREILQEEVVKLIKSQSVR